MKSIFGNDLIELFSFGDLYISNFIPISENSENYPKSEIKLCLDKTSGLVQLEKIPDFDLMYRNYWYSSGTNDSMKNELMDIVNSICKLIDIKQGDKWLDIASNDWTLLSIVPKYVEKYGCDPSNVAKENSVGNFVNDYFKKEHYKDKFKVITAIAMFYDLEDPIRFLQDVKDCLEDDGLFVIQMSYLPLMIKQLAFDNCVHEHLCYYSLETLKFLYDKAGFKIVDVILNDTNGGSFRVYAQKNDANINYFATSPYRDVANFRISSILNYEKSLDLKNESVYIDFFNKVNSLKNSVYNFIKSEVDNGKVIYGYGASTKGNTLLQYFNLDNSLITAIADRQAKKEGLKTVGTNIPIISESEMRNKKPDYLLMLPWHFVHEFKIREAEYLKSGGKFIIPCPLFEVV